MKQVLKEHDTGAALCRTCRKQTKTTYLYRDFSLTTPKLRVRRVLVGVCDVCQRTLTVPWQSNERIQATVRAARARTETSGRIEARVPSDLYERLRLIAARLEARDEAFAHVMLRFYLSQLSRSAKFAGRVRRLSVVREGSRASQRVSLRVSGKLYDQALKQAQAQGVTDQSALVRGLISAAYEDVFTDCSPQRRAVLECLADATN
ncbi:MAG: hypothetical protein IT348_02935 [Candidatus Eisenbacteria bacterium]|nr:hypothetical protein [Candidatus Eisenbacteria bacterium]